MKKITRGPSDRLTADRNITEALALIKQAQALLDRANALLNATEALGESRPPPTDAPDAPGGGTFH